MVDENINNETRLTRIQALVVEILNDLLRAPAEGTDASIHYAIERVGEYCRRDRSYVFVTDGEIANNTHEWCAEGIDPQIEQLQSLPISLYGPIADILLGGDTYHVPDMSELEAGSPSRMLLEMQQIQSILLVPIRAAGQITGFVGFDGVHNTHTFLPGEIYLLQSLADVIGAVLFQREKEEQVRAAQLELASERAFLGSILATSAMGVVVMDDEGVIQFANEAAEQIVGATREQMIGRRHDDKIWRYTREDGEAFEEGSTPFDQVMNKGKASATARYALHCPEGLRYCSVHVAPVLGDDGACTRVVYAMMDVTDQVAAERERQAALNDARRANAAKSNFLAKMSHEMRTPLNGVLGVAEVLEQLVENPDQKRMVKVMHDSGTLLLSIINDLLDMSKIEADQLEIEALPFVPSELAQRLETVHTLKASEKNISFGVSMIGDCDGARMGDQHRILQIMHNVISNAVKFTETGAVRVLVDCSNDAEVSIRVEDTGIGMSAEQQSQVFEEFGQADNSIARRFGGTGLGMPIVRRLVEMMGGTIDLVSAPDKGTLVIIKLPLARTDIADSPPVQMPVAMDTVDLKGLRVLAADDNRTNRMILGAMMGQLGIAAVLVADGTEALETYDREEFDLVILDISMPDMDGVTVQREIRKREVERALFAGKGNPATLLPIVAFTANAMSHQVETYVHSGFDDCLTKPLQLDKLRTALGRLIDERGRRCQPVGMGELVTLSR